MVWYSHLLKNFPSFVVIHTVKCFSIVNEAEVEVFLELSCFFYDPVDIGNLISGSSAFPKSSLNIWKLSVHVLLKPNLENHMGLECKYRIPRDTWSNRQDWPWSAKWNRKRLTEFCQENALVIANTCFQNTRNYSTLVYHQMVTEFQWISPLKSDWLYSLQPMMEKLYTVSKNKTRSWLWLNSNLKWRK